MNEKSDALKPKVKTIEEILFPKVPSSARAEVIEASVLVEYAISEILAALLRIDVDNSVSFGRQGLSFNAKLNLLADINMIAKDEKIKLTKFSEIRNLFAHNSNIVFFKDSFELNDLRSFFKKYYNEPKPTNGTSEKNDSLLFEKLFNDIKAICENLFIKRISNTVDISRQELKIQMFDALKATLDEFSAADPNFLLMMDEVYAKTKEKLGTPLDVVNRYKK